MQINLLKKVVENTAGPTAVKIVDLLFDKKDVNEFLIAKKLELTINQTRNLLYRLSHMGIIGSIRKKDKRKGWYIYFWTFNVLKSLGVLETGLENEIAKLKQQLSDKQKIRYYKCKMCGREVEEEEALTTNFMCSECGEVYELSNNVPLINEVVKEIEKLERELEHVKKEIAQEEGKNTVKLNRMLKREAKKKKEVRAAKMKQTKRNTKRLFNKAAKEKLERHNQRLSNAKKKKV
jgi:transcription factor E